MNDQHPPSHRTSSYAAPLYDTTVLTSALANPYAQHYASSHMSSHYYQAYMQAYSPRTTADGYTLSSTYVPGAANKMGKAAPPTPTSARDRPSVQPHPQSSVRPIPNHLTYGSWYQPGNCRCTRQGCRFTGSRKSVEIHMMDRHFIFPPGWEKKDNWDADPSLKGKPLVIQGTSLVLDTPEAIDAWIAERRRRFPTDEKVQDKKRKLEEAAARGQLTPEEMGAGARKKYRQNTASTEVSSKGSRNKGHRRGRGRRFGGPVQRGELERKNANNLASQSVVASTKCAPEASPSSGSIDGDDEPPEVVSSKVPTAQLCIPKVGVGRSGEEMPCGHPQEFVRRIPQPKKPPRNPFASRSTLLRNLLLPEIRITVSNLSQAIRFLVENDFLRDVELRPGEAQEKMIEVLGSSEVPCPAQHSAKTPPESYA